MKVAETIAVQLEVDRHLVLDRHAVTTKHDRIGPIRRSLILHLADDVVALVGRIQVEAGEPSVEEQPASWFDDALEVGAGGPARVADSELVTRRRLETPITTGASATTRMGTKITAITMTTLRDRRNGFRSPSVCRRSRSRRFLTAGSDGAAPRTSSSRSGSTFVGAAGPVALDWPSSGLASFGIPQNPPLAIGTASIVIEILTTCFEAAEAQVLLDHFLGEP